MAPWFNERNIALYAYDQPGFGENPHKGLWPGDDAMREALEKPYTAIRAKHGKTPIYLLGESMGGATILSTLARHPEWDIKGIILAAPGVRKDIDYRYGGNALMALATTFAPSSTVTLSYGTLSPAATRRVTTDPNMVKEVRMDTYYRLLGFSDDASDNAEKVKVPALILYGSGDRMIESIAICRLNESLEGSTLLYFPNEPHLLLQGEHYISHLNDIYDWMRKKPSRHIDSLKVHAAEECSKFKD